MKKFHTAYIASEVSDAHNFCGSVVHEPSCVALAETIDTDSIFMAKEGVELSQFHPV
jgi:hypothetical protein